MRQAASAGRTRRPPGEQGDVADPDIELAGGAALGLRRPAAQQVWRRRRTGRRSRRPAPGRPPSGAPICSTRPAFMTTTRLDSDMASTWSWVTRMKGRADGPGAIPRSSWRISSRRAASRLLSGSSSSSRRGSYTSARARATRCSWPPLSWCGVARLESLQAAQADHAADAVGDLAPGTAAHAQRQPDIVLHRHVGPHRERLEHQAHVAHFRRHMGSGRGEHGPVEVDFPRCPGAAVRRSGAASSSCRIRSARAG